MSDVTGADDDFRASGRYDTTEDAIAAARAAQPSHAVFYCSLCRRVWTAPGSGIVASQATAVSHVMMYEECLGCGNLRGSVLPPVEAPTWFGSVTYFGDEAVRDGLVRAHEELLALGSAADLGDVVAVLERQGLHALARYVRDNHQFLLSLGVGLAALVISMLQWLQPQAPETTEPPVPDGVSYDQMQQLIDDLRTEVDTSHPTQRDGHQKRDDRRDEGQPAQD